MADIPPQELDVLLCHYFMKAKKLSAEEYEPDILKSHLGNFDRYLHGKGKQYNIIAGPMFRKCNEVLAKKCRQLKTVYGKGCKLNKAESLTDLEIDKLWRDGELGDHSPRALLNTMWFFFTTHYGWHGRGKCFKLKYGDVVLRKDQFGVEYIEWLVERDTKARTEESSSTKERQFNPKIWATEDDECPVRLIMIRPT